MRLDMTKSSMVAAAIFHNKEEKGTVPFFSKKEKRGLSPFLYSINLDIYKARRLSDVRKNRIIDIHL